MALTNFAFTFTNPTNITPPLSQITYPMLSLSSLAHPLLKVGVCLLTAGLGYW